MRPGRLVVPQHRRQICVVSQDPLQVAPECRMLPAAQGGEGVEVRLEKYVLSAADAGQRFGCRWPDTQPRQAEQLATDARDHMRFGIVEVLYGGDAEWQIVDREEAVLV